MIWEFIMPVSERPRVLAYLDERSINAYSLFSTEDSLISSLAMREFLFKPERL